MWNLTKVRNERNDRNLQQRRVGMFDSILRLIGDCSDVIGIVGAVFAFLAWVKLRMQNKRLIELSRVSHGIENFQDQMKYWSEIRTLNPHAFAISLLPHGGSIKEDVKRFLKTKGNKWEDMPIVELNVNGLGPKNLEEYINQLRIKRKELDLEGATEIHLFFAGPVQAATLIGAMFDNWRPVMLYHNNRDKGNYEFWCPLVK